MCMLPQSMHHVSAEYPARLASGDAGEARDDHHQGCAEAMSARHRSSDEEQCEGVSHIRRGHALPQLIINYL